MRAIRPSQIGGPEVLELREFPTPSPGPNAALVRVEAAGVNFIDIYQRSGQYKLELPLLLGSEGAGVVEKVGPDTTGVKPGDRVAWAAGPGSYATHAVIPADRLVHIPPGMDFKLAAATMLQGMTAHYLARDTYPLGPKDTCLLHAAAGGVGLLFCQLAKRAKVRVIGTVSTEEKAEAAKAAGADEVILYSRRDFVADVRQLTANAGVNVVYDSVGKDTFDKSLLCLKRRGMMVLFGQSSGPVPPVDPQLLNVRGSLFLTRPNLAHYTATHEELEMRAGDLFAAIDAGALRVTIGAALPLAQAAEAHRMLSARKTIGKILLLPQG